jgi:hypothetical protein
MKERFWNVLIEVYEDGPVKAAVLRSREAETRPPDSCREEPGREIFSLWYETEAAAQGAVLEAKAMDNKVRVAA